MPKSNYTSCDKGFNVRVYVHQIETMAFYARLAHWQLHNKTVNAISRAQTFIRALYCQWKHVYQL